MKSILYISIVLLLVSCGKQTSTKPVRQTQQVQKAVFSADSAYRFIADQVALGPRIVNSEAHKRCVTYLTEQLQRFGADVELQTGEMSDYANQTIPIVNIIGRYNKEAKQRVLLAAHYDSRPWADHDPDQTKHQTPILGANDGASGVGVLLEMARQLQQANTQQGIDIVFFDAEDMGAPEFYSGKDKEDDWCLGSQLWAQRIKSQNLASDYRFGIVLDMVGAGDATFPHEYFSERYASEYVKQIWKTATQLGYGRYFNSAMSYPITDDHYYVNTIADIPCVDVIHYVNPTQYGESGFCASWHTVNDNLQVINKNTLDAVGTTIMTYISETSK